MEIEVSNVNEHKFAPDFMGNKEAPDNAKFFIVLKRTNTFLSSGRWTTTKTDAGGLAMTTDFVAKIRQNFVRIDNAPVLKINGGKASRQMTIDDVLSEEFPALFPLAKIIWDEICEIENMSAEDEKK